MNKVDNYLEVLYLAEEADILQEGLGDILKKITLDKGKQLVNIVKSGDGKKLKSFGNSLGINRIKPKAMDSFTKNKVQNFSETKDFTKRVLKNSIPGLSKKMIEHTSSAIAVASVIPKKKGLVVKSPKNRARELVKNVVVKSRKWQDDYMEKQADKGERTSRIPEESIPDYAVGITVVLTLTAILGGGAWIFVNYLIPFLSAAFWIVLIGGPLLGIAWGIGQAMGGGK